MQQLHTDAVREYIRGWTAQKRLVVVDRMKRTAELVSAGWTRHIHAGRLENGELIRVPYSDPTATHFCPRGGMLRAIDELVVNNYACESERVTSSTLELLCGVALTGRFTGNSLPDWNDFYASQEDVLELFGAVISTVESTLMPELAPVP